jgi:hypothetical protein
VQECLAGVTALMPVTGTAVAKKKSVPVSDRADPARHVSESL